MDRDISIDFLRFIALSGIILVHIAPSSFWCQLRSFDVPLIVLLSGVSYSISSGVNDNYLDYCIKRFKRLVLPVWFFLIIYFIGSYIICNNLPTLKKVISYYTLMTGWYVWVIRVFFIIALVAPLIKKKIDVVNNIKTIFIIFFVLIIFEYINVKQLLDFKGGLLISINIPYLVVFIFGYKLKSISDKMINMLIFVFFLLYIFYAYYYFNLNDIYIYTYEKKYPPQLYYTSYALFCCLILWKYRHEIVNIIPFRIRPLFIYIGSHTIWIYLWHIPFVSLFGGIQYAFIRYFLVYFFSVLITYMQTYLIYKYVNTLNNEKFAKFLKMVFIG